jgi:hypothetical protein
MEEEENNDWDFVRTNNGEWIRAVHATIMVGVELIMMEVIAKEKGKSLIKHCCYDDCGEKYYWCYKQDVDELLKKK